MNKLIIAPSILSMDYSDTKGQMNQINESKAEWIHFDVMDGHFVPNITFGPDIMKGIRKLTDRVIDAHLMIENPNKYIPEFVKAGADYITVHTEAFNNDVEEIRKSVELMHSLNVKGGFVVKPGTPIEQFESLLKDVDLVLVMSVEPGFGGQSFMANQLAKVEWLCAKRDELNLNYRIEIDGGINDKTYKQAVDAGVDTMVAGSFVFKNGIVESVERLLK